MEALLTSLAEQSPVAVVSLFAIWRISMVMMVLVEGFVAITTAASDNLTELVDNSVAGS